MRLKYIFPLFVGILALVACKKETVDELNVTNSQFYLDFKLNGSERSTTGTFTCPDPHAFVYQSDSTPFVLFQAVPCDGSFIQFGGTIPDFVGPGYYTIDEDDFDSPTLILQEDVLNPLYSTEGELRVKFFRETKGSSPGYIDITFSGIMESADGSISKTITKGEGRLILREF